MARLASFLVMQLVVPLLAAGALGTLVSLSVASPIAGEPHVPHSRGLAEKKDALREGGAAEKAAPVILATLVQTHTGERVLLDDQGPPLERFDALLGDRTTGEHGSLDPRLIGLLRQLARGVDTDADAGAGETAAAAPARIELVSGYRSAKLNERLRKKGHHVASHSQHSLGHAVDFRLIPATADAALEPSLVRERIRALGWQGGIGIYPTETDRFVHADVGPNRDWKN